VDEGQGVLDSEGIGEEDGTLDVEGQGVGEGLGKHLSSRHTSNTSNSSKLLPLGTL